MAKEYQILAERDAQTRRVKGRIIELNKSIDSHIAENEANEKEHIMIESEAKEIESDVEEKG